MDGVRSPGSHIIVTATIACSTVYSVILEGHTATERGWELSACGAYLAGWLLSRERKLPYTAPSGRIQSLMAVLSAW